MYDLLVRHKGETDTNTKVRDISCYKEELCNKFKEIWFNSKVKNDYIKLLTHELDDFLIEMS